MRTTIRISAQAPLDFAATAYSHGWVVLEPNGWCKEQQVLRRVERLGTGKVVQLSVSGSGTWRNAEIVAGVETRTKLAPGERRDISGRVKHMFRVDEELGEFYRECRKRGGHWKKLTKGLGRLLRSPSVFEDVVKVICTTNVQWGGTKRMVAELVAAYGDPMPGSPHLRAFPRPEAIAAVTPKQFADSVRLGYRAPYIHTLAQRAASGELDLEALHDPEIPTPELKRRLLAVKGIGPYAAATLLMLLGRYDDLAVDTVCREFVTNKYFNGKRPSESQIQQVYEDWGRWRYLAYWFDLWAGLDEKL